MIMMTGGGAEISGLTASAGVGAGVEVRFEATTQRVFGYRVDALDAQSGAVVVRDTIPARWASAVPIQTDTTLFAGQLPAGSYRIRVTPLGRGSYADRVPIEADAVESGVVVGAREGPAVASAGLTLALRGANPIRGDASFALSLLIPDDVSVSVFDLLGRQVGGIARRAYPAVESPVRLDTSQLPSGRYVVRAAGTGNRSAALRIAVLSRSSLN